MAQSNVPDVGTGATLTFESGLAVTLVSMEWSGFERSFGPTSHLGTTGGMTFKPGRLYDPGRLACTMRWSKDQPFLTKMLEAPESCTITFPQQTGETTPTTLAGSAFLVSHGGTIALEDVMEARADIKFTGTLTFTPAT